MEDLNDEYISDLIRIAEEQGLCVNCFHAPACHDDAGGCPDDRELDLNTHICNRGAHGP